MAARTPEECVIYASCKTCLKIPNEQVNLFIYSTNRRVVCKSWCYQILARSVWLPHKKFVMSVSLLYWIFRYLFMLYENKTFVFSHICSSTYRIPNSKMIPGHAELLHPNRKHIAEDFNLFEFPCPYYGRGFQFSSTVYHFWITKFDTFFRTRTSQNLPLDFCLVDSVFVSKLILSKNCICKAFQWKTLNHVSSVTFDSKRATVSIMLHEKEVCNLKQTFDAS